VSRCPYGYDNLDPKFLVVRKGDQQFDDSLPPSARVDYRTDKPGQSVIDVANIQVRLNTLGKSLSQLSTLEEIDMVNQYLQTHIVNQYSMIQVPTDGTVYVVKGASFVTTQKSVSNVRNMLRQAIMNLKFPEGVSRKEVIQETLEDVVSRMTGVRNKVRVIENVQIGQGEKVGRYISGAIQQPIMQAALNSVVWEEKMLIRREHDIAVEPIGQFIDRFLDGELSESIQRYPLNNTEYLDVSQYGYEIQSVDEFGKVSWKLIEALTRHEVPEGGLIHVKTTSGREVTATVGKSFLVRRNNKIVQIEGSELKLGDRLPVTRQAPEVVNPIENLDVTRYFPKTQYIYSEEARKAFAERDSGKVAWWSDGKKKGLFSLPYSRSDCLLVAINKGKIDMTKDEIYNMNGTKASKIPCNIILDELSGFFFGAFLADGCANEYQVILSKKDEKFRSKVLSFASRYDIPYHTVVSPARNTLNGESNDIRFHSQMWAKVLREECGVSAETKRISPWMLLANKEFAKGLIDGYFSGDGTVNKRCYSIIATSASKDLLVGMSEMLSRFGIVSKISGHTLKSNNLGTKNILPIHSITVRNEYSKIFYEEIGLTHSDKMNVLKNIVLKDMSKTLGLYEKFPLRLSSDVSDKEYLKKDLQTMLDNQALNESDRKIVQEALDSDVYFDEIVSITPASTTDNHPKVYDFTIQDTRNFASFGGLHNADTFHSSGTTSSASNVKDRFIRLVTASSAGKRSGTMIMNKTPNNFYDAYRIRNQVREISLATILKDPAPQMNYDVSPMDTVPELVRKLLTIEFPAQVEELLTGASHISFISFLYDPLMLKSSGLSTMDLKRFLSSISTNDFKIFPVITKDSFYLFTSEKDSTKARNGFQRNVIARLSDHKLNFGYRLSGEGMEEMYPTEFKITDGIKSVYRTSEGYLVQMNRRHMNRFGYSFDKVVKMFEVAGVSGNMIVNPSKAQIVFPGATTSPLKLVEQKLAVEADVMEADWRKSIEVNRRKEPLPGPVTQSAYGYYMKTIGGNMKFMMRNPQVNYRASYNDGILEIEENLGLRAARNFMVHEIEQIFALSGANEIDYRHVVLMIDSMVSQGSISRLTFQGVDKIAGPNPLNQAGVGFAPTSTFAVAALKKKDFSADVGYAVNFLATRSKIVREKTLDERVTTESQKDKIKSYLSKLPSLKKSKEKAEVDYQVLKTVRQRERNAIDSTVPISDLPLPSRVDVCERPVIAYSKAFENDITEYYDGFMNGLDVFGEPTEL
jgi:intein/homing endonuclease